MRHLGLAARFASGYLIQLKADVKALDGPSGTAVDFTDLHAWTEVYIPGAGWIGLDPTSGLLAGEGHIPLACTAMPSSAAPVIGGTDKCEAHFDFAMHVTRIHEDPRVTQPYTEAQWQAVLDLGHQVDAELEKHDVRLTMGGEPTFVSIDDMDGPEWNYTALSDKKRELAGELLKRLQGHFAPGAMLHFGQGKWYPGEPLPRWALGVWWRVDGQPLWRDPALTADTRAPGAVDLAAVVHQPRQHPRHIAVDQWRRSVERERHHGSGGVSPHAGQGEDFRQGVGKHAVMTLDHHPRRLLEVPGPVVVPQPLPQRQHPRFRSGRQRIHIGKGLHPPDIVPPLQHHGQRRLLQHHLGYQHRIRIRRPPPWIVPALLAKPAAQRLPEGGWLLERAG